MRLHHKNWLTSLNVLLEWFSAVWEAWEKVILKLRFKTSTVRAGFLEPPNFFLWWLFCCISDMAWLMVENHIYQYLLWSTICDSKGGANSSLPSTRRRGPQFLLMERRTSLLTIPLLYHLEKLTGCCLIPRSLGPIYHHQQINPAILFLPPQLSR